MLADQPRLISWKVLLALVLDTLRRSICGPHANGGETSFQPTLGTVSPTHVSPLDVGQHVFGRPRQDIRNVPLARAPPIGNRPDQLYPDRIHLKVTRDANGPGNAASEPAGLLLQASAFSPCKVCSLRSDWAGPAWH